MEATARNDFVSVEDYLAAEEASEVCREYFGGLVYAKADEIRAHNQIVGNLCVAVRQHLRGGPCKLYLSDIRVNLSIRDDACFYYPDLVVTCDPRDTDPRFVRHPRMIIEVMPSSMERGDKREKFFTYTTLESLEDDALVAQTPPEVTLFRRTEGWRAVKVAGPDAHIPLASLQFTLPLAAINEGL